MPDLIYDAFDLSSITQGLHINGRLPQAANQGGAWQQAASTISGNIVQSNSASFFNGGAGLQQSAYSASLFGGKYAQIDCGQQAPADRKFVADISIDRRNVFRFFPLVFDTFQDGASLAASTLFFVKSGLGIAVTYGNDLKKLSIGYHYKAQTGATADLFGWTNVKYSLSPATDWGIANTFARVTIEWHHNGGAGGAVDSILVTVQPWINGLTPATSTDPTGTAVTAQFDVQAGHSWDNQPLLTKNNGTKFVGISGSYTFTGNPYNNINNAYKFDDLSTRIANNIYIDEIHIVDISAPPGVGNGHPFWNATTLTLELYGALVFRTAFNTQSGVGPTFDALDSLTETPWNIDEHAGRIVVITDDDGLGNVWRETRKIVSNTNFGFTVDYPLANAIGVNTNFRICFDASSLAQLASLAGATDLAGTAGNFVTSDVHGNYKINANLLLGNDAGGDGPAFFAEGEKTLTFIESAVLESSHPSVYMQIGYSREDSKGLFGDNIQLTTPDSAPPVNVEWRGETVLYGVSIAKQATNLLGNTGSAAIAGAIEYNKGLDKDTNNLSQTGGLLVASSFVKGLDLYIHQDDAIENSLFTGGNLLFETAPLKFTGNTFSATKLSIVGAQLATAGFDGGDLYDFIYQGGAAISRPIRLIDFNLNVDSVHDKGVAYLWNFNLTGYTDNAGTTLTDPYYWDQATDGVYTSTSGVLYRGATNDITISKTGTIPTTGVAITVLDANGVDNIVTGKNADKTIQTNSGTVFDVNGKPVTAFTQPGVHVLFDTVTHGTGTASTITSRPGPFTQHVRGYGFVPIDIDKSSWDVNSTQSDSLILVEDIYVDTVTYTTPFTTPPTVVDTVTPSITINKTMDIEELYAYLNYYYSQHANHQYNNPLTTADGKNYILTGYDLDVGAFTLTTSSGAQSITLPTNTFIKTSGGASFFVIDITGSSVPINITNIATGTRVTVYDAATGIPISGFPVDVTSGTSASVPYTYTADLNVIIRARKSSGVPKYLPYEASGTITSSGMNIAVTQVLDTIA